jgi:hypothetical protein
MSSLHSKQTRTKKMQYPGGNHRIKINPPRRRKEARRIPSVCRGIEVKDKAKIKAS